MAAGRGRASGGRIPARWRIGGYENSGGRSGRGRRLFRRTSPAGGPRRDVPRSPAPGGRARETRADDPEPLGDFHRPSPPVVSRKAWREPFDLVMLELQGVRPRWSDGVIRRAVGPATAILPLLNGMRHLERLAERFGPQRVLGGQCAISATPRRRRRRPPSQRFACAQLRRTGRLPHAADRGRRLGDVQRWLRRPAHQRDQAGNVGEVGVYRRRGGHNLSHAGVGRRLLSRPAPPISRAGCSRNAPRSPPLTAFRRANRRWRGRVRRSPLRAPL